MRTPRVLKRWLMAISSSTVARVTVHSHVLVGELAASRALIEDLCGLVIQPRRLFGFGASVFRHQLRAGRGIGVVDRVSLLFQASKAGRNSGRKRRSKRSASFLSPWASAFSHSTTVDALYKRS